ncbi:hypothetical protein KBC04_04965 [Candidatus Babeliales bacterium]|nr:hypothetical protein [Candidatus Babeliales bacterium]MBP9844316.1 hypothetical protein [Candidatus Babeliales bacterium]
MSTKYAFYAYILLSNCSSHLIANKKHHQTPHVTLRSIKNIEASLLAAGFENLNRRSGLMNKLNKENLTIEEIQAKVNWAVEYLHGDRFGTDVPTLEQRQTMELDKKKLVTILLNIPTN